MKISAFFLSVILFFSLNTTIAKHLNKVQDYKVNDDVIEQLFNASDDISLLTYVAGFGVPSQTKLQDDNDTQLVAGIVALASLITGVGILIPFHRLILGTGNEVGKIMALYCFTLSGCGFILLVDGIMLLMNPHGNSFIENSKFIMWQDQM